MDGIWMFQAWIQERGHWKWILFLAPAVRVFSSERLISADQTFVATAAALLPSEEQVMAAPVAAT
jgi:hypothetical protein